MSTEGQERPPAWNMLSASLYIVLCSTRNRVMVRIRRLREPRYMIGALAGAAYVYVSFFRRFSRPRRPARGGFPATSLAALVAGREAMVTGWAGAALLALAALAWIVPTDSSLLDFSAAEINFLFPGPVSRRQLLIHRMTRSQVPLLFGAVMSSLVVPFAAASRLRFALGVFVILVTMRAYFTGVTLARTRLTAAPPAARLMAWAPFILIVAAVGTVGAAVGRAYGVTPGGDPALWFERASEAIRAGVAGVALQPFVALVRPVFAGSYRDFWVRFAEALVVLAVTVGWVLRSDEAFQDAAQAVQERNATKKISAPGRTRLTGWALPLTGRTEMLFLWKNGLQTLRGTNLSQALPLLVPLAVLTVVGATARMSATHARGPAAAFATGSLAVAGFCALLGPQAMRSDLRGDLLHLELLRTWPVRGAAVIRGEILWPTGLLTCAAWFALICATIFSEAAFPKLDVASRLSLAAAAILVAPALIAAQFTVHNAAAVLFPAWVPTGRQRPRGFDAMGQRLILFGGVVIALAVIVGPGAIAGAIVTFVFYRVIGPVSLVPAAVACVMLVVIEVLVITEMLGAAYDRIDLSQVERAE